jgi:8-oxo-dGTP diphosphatase
VKSFKDYAGYTINLTFNTSNLQSPTDVLVFPFFNGDLVLTDHRKRGLELPGGKIEQNETPLAAAVREVFEECGATLTSITLIGQYEVLDYNVTSIIKSIYVAKVSEICETEYITDTSGPVIFQASPIDVSKDKFSPFMKDNVYPLTLKHLKSNNLVP